MAMDRNPSASDEHEADEHFTLTMTNDDSNDSTEAPIAAHATIDFAMPVWSQPLTNGAAASKESHNPTQKLVSHNDDTGYTVWTDYEAQSSMVDPLQVAVVARGSRENSISTEQSIRREQSMSESTRVPSRERSTSVFTRVLSRSSWRRGSGAAMADVYYSKAKHWTSRHTRPLWAQRVFEYSFYALLLACLYFFVVGKPLWDGAVYGFWHFSHSDTALEAGMAIFWGVAAFYAIGPLCSQFQPYPVFDEEFKVANREKARETSLLIPCYKSAAAIGATLEAALKIFPPQNIFVLDNGNSPTPFDDTRSICMKYGVRYFWISTGSKIVAQFIGCQAAGDFPYSLLIDDDCTLPEDFPLRTERIQLGSRKRLVKCLGYAIASVGTGGSKGTMCQQAQDLEYKLSGMSRYFFGSWGSASFPHGAIALWDREFLSLCFRKHPGYTISEDWFFGHVCRQLGGRIQMCNEIFVKTETPPACVRGSKKGSRAGYGEMTVVSQRMTRWNFFLVSRIFTDASYLAFSWNLGFYEVSTKLVVFQEIYESLLLLCFPVVTPILFVTQPRFTLYITVAVIGMYIVTVSIFNEVHLRRKKATISRKVVYLYYPPYKTFLRLVNVWSTIRDMYMYPRYFRARHPSIFHNEKAMENLVRLIDEHQLHILRRASVASIHL